jgi:hypothetical protein
VASLLQVFNIEVAVNNFPQHAADDLHANVIKYMFDFVTADTIDEPFTAESESFAER